MVSVLRPIGLLLVVLGTLIVLPIVQYFRVVWGSALTVEIIFWVLASVLVAFGGFFTIVMGAFFLRYGDVIEEG